VTIPKPFPTNLERATNSIRILKQGSQMAALNQIDRDLTISLNPIGLCAKNKGALVLRSEVPSCKET